MKTKTNTITDHEIVQHKKQIQTIDRDHYIPLLIDHEATKKNTIVLIMSGGCFNNLLNIPKGYDYTLFDWDDLKEMPEQEFKELVEKLESETMGKK